MAGKVFNFRTPLLDAIQTVYCDLCKKDYSFSGEEGGLLYALTPVCPDCAPVLERTAKRTGEEYLIRQRCPKGKSFRDWVLEELR